MATAKQLAARKKFVAMVRARKGSGKTGQESVNQGPGPTNAKKDTAAGLRATAKENKKLAGAKKPIKAKATKKLSGKAYWAQVKAQGHR